MKYYELHIPYCKKKYIYIWSISRTCAHTHTMELVFVYNDHSLEEHSIKSNTWELLCFRMCVHLSILVHLFHLTCCIVWSMYKSLLVKISSECVRYFFVNTAIMSFFYIVLYWKIGNKIWCYMKLIFIWLDYPIYNINMEIGLLSSTFSLLCSFCIEI